MESDVTFNNFPGKCRGKLRCRYVLREGECE
jgi:hypothetical protein